MIKWKSPKQYSKLSFKIGAETAPDLEDLLTVRPIVDDKDIVQTTLSDEPYIGFHSKDFFAQPSLLNGGFANLALCSCGIEECGSGYMYVKCAHDYIAWTFFIDVRYNYMDFATNCSQEEFDSYKTVYFEKIAYDILIPNMQRKVEALLKKEKTYSTLEFAHVFQGTYATRTLVDGIDILRKEDANNLARGSRVLFAQNSLLAGGYAMIGLCCCGCEGCGDLWVHVKRDSDCYTWNYFVYPQDEDDVPPEELHELPEMPWYIDVCKQHGPVYFRKEQYEEAIAAAKASLELWQTPLKLFHGQELIGTIYDACQTASGMYGIIDQTQAAAKYTKIFEHYLIPHQHRKENTKFEEDLILNWTISTEGGESEEVEPPGIQVESDVAHIYWKSPQSEEETTSLSS